MVAQNQQTGNRAGPRYAVQAKDHHWTVVDRSDGSVVEAYPVRHRTDGSARRKAMARCRELNAAWQQVAPGVYEGRPRPRCFRVWFQDGSAVLVDAIDEAEASATVEAGIRSGQYVGRIRKVECLDG